MAQTPLSLGLSLLSPRGSAPNRNVVRPPQRVPLTVGIWLGFLLLQVQAAELWARKNNGVRTLVGTGVLKPQIQGGTGDKDGDRG